MLPTLLVIQRPNSLLQAPRFPLITFFPLRRGSMANQSTPADVSTNIPNRLYSQLIPTSPFRKNLTFKSASSIGYFLTPILPSPYCCPLYIPMVRSTTHKNRLTAPTRSPKPKTYSSSSKCQIPKPPTTESLSHTSLALNLRYRCENPL